MRHRGVARLDGVRGKKQVWWPMFEPTVFRKQMYYIEECSLLVTLLGLFGAPIVIRLPGELCPPLTPLVMPVMRRNHHTALAISLAAGNCTVRNASILTFASLQFS